MDCPQNPWPSDDEFLRRFNTAVDARRIPISGTVDLTHRCNFRCRHCYLGKRRSASAQQAGELDRGQWRRIFDEFTAAGCLYLLLSGGEPLLHPDFAEIYAHAKARGLLVTVFTNATRITGETAALFQRLPPQTVEVSLYGATAETSERITGVRNALESALTGIHRLLAAGVNVTVKTVLMRSNQTEYRHIRRLAEDLGVKFRFDAAISPCLDGDTGPLAERVPPETAVAVETADPKRVDQWRNYYTAERGAPRSGDLYGCGAGRTNFYISPQGRLQPCLMTTDLGGDLTRETFAGAWQKVVAGIRGQRARSDFPCLQCEKILLCDYCPAFFRLETGRPDVASAYVCAVGRLRFEKIIDAMREISPRDGGRSNRRDRPGKMR